MTMLTKGTWVLVAGSEKALFLENITDTQDPHLQVRRKDEQDNPPDREQSASRPGRFNDGPSVHRSAVDDTDWHQLAKERFAADLAERLHKMVQGGRFDRLVLVAAPEVLGELRKKLHQDVSDRVVGEIAKNLINHETGRIEDLVKEALANA
ncbi:host attachment family protein [Leisingera thetidis]|uniref:host attachment family protein n=1 Tax=Leisingera thetidis TaxID=2930199 RepID=UPI0021F7B702|nr:host attachment family protein [Leisingera thetidis]